MTNSALRGVHHVAYRCKDAKQTVEFYQEMLGAKYTIAFAEDHVPSTGAYDPYMHVFIDIGGGNILAFFELPEQPDMARDSNTPEWVQHLALKVDNEATLLAAKARLTERGVDVLGPTDHGIFRSIYFFDPNGHRLELTHNTGTPDEQAELERVAPLMLEEWSRTKKAPQHAAWLHEKARAAHAAARKS
jgi:glyoxylase I family protein